MKTGLLLGLDGVGKTLLLRQLAAQLMRHHKSIVDKLRAFAHQHLQTVATTTAAANVQQILATAHEFGNNVVNAAASNLPALPGMNHDASGQSSTSGTLNSARGGANGRLYSVGMGPSSFAFLVHRETQPTIGVEHTQLTVEAKTCSICEVGGQLLPMWKAYFDSSDFWIYVIDLSNPSQLAGAVLELYNILRCPDMRQKPKLVLLNKTDSFFTIDDQMVQSYLGLDHLFRMAVPTSTPQTARRMSLSMGNNSSSTNMANAMKTDPVSAPLPGASGLDDGTFHHNLMIMKISALTGENMDPVIKWLAHQLQSSSSLSAAAVGSLARSKSVLVRSKASTTATAAASTTPSNVHPIAQAGF